MRIFATPCQQQEMEEKNEANLEGFFQFTDDKRWNNDGPVIVGKGARSLGDAYAMQFVKHVAVFEMRVSLSSESVLGRRWLGGNLVEIELLDIGALPVCLKFDLGVVINIETTGIMMKQ